MMVSQLQAIRRGLDCLSLTLVDEVAKKHMDIFAPSIRMMRDGVKDDDPLLWDFEPVDFEAYFEALMASASLEVGAKRKVAIGAVNLSVPSGYTYLGQFVDHDFTLDVTPLEVQKADPLAIKNFRSPAVDLDSLYGDGPSVSPERFARATTPPFGMVPDAGRRRRTAQAPR